MPITIAEWNSLDNFANSGKYWLGAQFTNTSQPYADIEWMYNNTFCSNLTYSNTLPKVKYNPTKTCTIVTGSTWKQDKCTINNKYAAVCEFGTLI